MGCFHSTPAKAYEEEVVKNNVTEEPRRNDQSKKDSNQSATQVGRRAVSFAENVRDNEGVDPVSGRMSRKSGLVGRTPSFIGADLHSITDERGMLNQMVSRQLSVMSHYSVKSELGSVMITPENAKAPFKLLRLIGRGGFGNVYLGIWEDEEVAIKVIAGNTNPDLLPEEKQWEARKERMAQMEAVLMSAIHHPNIVNTHKVTSHSGDDVDADLLLVERRLLASAGSKPDPSGIPSFEWHIIMEYCDKGSLSKVLATFKLHEPLDNHTVLWDAWASLETLKETAIAIAFLHEHKILHGDLKAANVLLSSTDDDRRGWTSKVSDFGLSRVISSDQIKTHTFGTVTHMPPELLARGRLLPSSDVFAFGVVMWEVFTGEKVFKQLSDSEVILAVVTKRARPTFPSDCPSRYRFLAEKCWAEMYELRPSWTHILKELQVLQDTLCPEGQDSPKIPVRVYPSRQRTLEHYRLHIAQTLAHQSSSSVTGVTPHHRDPPRNLGPLKQSDHPTKSTTGRVPAAGAMQVEGTQAKSFSEKMMKGPRSMGLDEGLTQGPAPRIKSFVSMKDKSRYPSKESRAVSSSNITATLSPDPTAQSLNGNSRTGEGRAVQFQRTVKEESSEPKRPSSRKRSTKQVNFQDN